MSHLFITSVGLHFWVLVINQNIIEVHYYKDIELLDKDLIDLSLETSWGIG